MIKSRQWREILSKGNRLYTSNISKLDFSYQRESTFNQHLFIIEPKLLIKSPNLGIRSLE